MPKWSDVVTEINQTSTIGPVDAVRRKYLRKLAEHTGRNIIAYYSGWLQVGAKFGTDINDMDINGFMSTICGLDCRKGLDLVLHTPGGSISAAEQLVTYLRSKFGNDIRAIVPQIAMSAGTMIACACKTIVMGKQSCLGPFDPQINGVSTKRVLDEFEQAKKEIRKDPSCIPLWQVIISKYHPTFVLSCELSCKRADKLVTDWLSTNMLLEEKERVSELVRKFIEIGQTDDHDRHISLNDAISYGLKIEQLEVNQEFQDLVLTVHHAFIQTLTQGGLVKAIENQDGIGMFNFAR